MKKFLLLTLCAALLSVACGEYDDGPLQERVGGLEQGLEDHEKRIAQLEELCKQLNTNIVSLQGLIASLQNSDTIVSVTPVLKEGQIIGYTIAFTKSQPITIYNGKDGATPVIGVAQFEGRYYWTVDGKWLTGPGGEKIKAEGSGNEIPKLKIENGHWWLSTDNGKTWKDLGPATGEDGDSLFRSVTQDDEKVTFTLADGTVIEIPKASRLQITLATTECALSAGVPKEIAYTLTGANAETRVEVVASDVVKARILSQTATGGVIELLCNEPQAIDDYTRVLVFASDGLRSAVAALTFEFGVLRVTESYEADAAGETFDISVETNLDYTIEIEEAAQGWLSRVDTRAVRTETLQFKAAPNEGTARSGIITLTAGSIVRKVCVAQKSGQVTLEITLPADFSTSNVQKAMYNGKQVAEICLEYIRSGQTDAQMIVVYPIKEGGGADLTKGIDASTGGTVVWDTAANTCVHTPGQAATPLTKLYSEPDGTLVVSTQSTETKPATIAADILVDVRGSASETYKIVKIGTQYWMAENLRAEHYADGTAIPIEEWTSSTATGACVYMYSLPSEYKADFGALYNGYAVQDTRGLAPAGWDIPDNAAWLKMKAYIGASGAGTKLKATTYWTTNPGTNVTGLNLLPAQSYSSPTGFIDNATETWLWSNTSATDFGQPALHYVRITDRGTGMTLTDGLTLHGLGFGHSIRCVRK